MSSFRNALNKLVDVFRTYDSVADKHRGIRWNETLGYWEAEASDGTWYKIWTQENFATTPENLFEFINSPILHLPLNSNVECVSGNASVTHTRNGQTGVKDSLSGRYFMADKNAPRFADSMLYLERDSATNLQINSTDVGVGTGYGYNTYTSRVDNTTDTLAPDGSNDASAITLQSGLFGYDCQVASDINCVQSQSNVFSVFFKATGENLLRASDEFNNGTYWTGDGSISTNVGFPPVTSQNASAGQETADFTTDRWTSTGSVGSYRQQNIPVSTISANRRYTFVIWVRRVSGTITSNDQVRIEGNTNWTPDATTNCGTVLAGDTRWHRFVHTGTTTASVTGGVNFKIICDVSAQLDLSSAQVFLHAISGDTDHTKMPYVSTSTDVVEGINTVEMSFVTALWYTTPDYEATFNTIDGTILSATDGTNRGIEEIGNGWYRAWIRYTPTTATTKCKLYMGQDSRPSIDTGDYLYVWGWQLEAPHTGEPSSFIKTLTTSESKNSDYFDIDVSNVPVFDKSFTIIMEVEPTKDASLIDQYLFEIQSEDSRYLKLTSTTNTAISADYGGGANEVQTTTVLAKDTKYTVAYVVDADITRLRVYINGSQIGAQTSDYTAFTGTTDRIRIYNVDAKISNIRIYDKALNSSELGTL